MAKMADLRGNFKYIGCALLEDYEMQKHVTATSKKYKSKTNTH